MGAKGGLNHEQFQDMMKKLKEKCIENDKLNEALLVFDRGGVGDVAVDDLNKAMKTLFLVPWVSGAWYKAAFSKFRFERHVSFANVGETTGHKM